MSKNYELESIIDDLIGFIDVEEVSSDFILTSDDAGEIPDDVIEDNRDYFRGILEPLINSRDLIKVLLEQGIEDLDIWEDSLAIWGKDWS